MLAVCVVPGQGHTIVLIPRNASGVTRVQPLTVFGYDDAPFGHARVDLEAAAAGPIEDAVLGGRAGVGQGQMMAQARLGPGRIHHCMRAVGLGERCLEMAIRRAASRVAFGRSLLAQSAVQRDLARSRASLDAAAALVAHAAGTLEDTPRGALGREARAAIAAVKLFVPTTIADVIDLAIQIHGAAGLEGSGVLARAYAGMRSLRIADGPDDVHARVLATLEAARVLGDDAVKDALTTRRPAASHL